MTTGTKSILIGIHQFLWHPITVTLAWIDLYGFPKPWELFCILVHDLGYIGKQEMDCSEEDTHPELGAKIAGAVFGKKARLECLGHSRSYAVKHNIPISRLCWADKWSPMFDPTHFYWLRGTLSGEIKEYRKTFPRANGASSLMWTVAFKKHIRENAHNIWAAAKENKEERFPYIQTSLDKTYYETHPTTAHP